MESHTKTKLSEESVRQLSKELDEPEWLLASRLNAFKQFSKLEWPLFKYGLNIQMDVSGLKADAVDPLASLGIKQEIQKSSEDGIIIEPLHAAIKEHPDLVKAHFSKTAGAMDKFTAMHYAFWAHGTLVHIQKGRQCKVTQQVVQQMRSNVLMDHVLLIAEPMSRLDFVESINSGPSEGVPFRNQHVEIFAGENAHVNYADIQCLGKEVFNFSFKKGIVRKDATLNWLDCCLGSRFSKVDITSSLQGDGAKTNNWGIFFGSDDQQFDLSSTTRHEAPHTVCDMLTKGVLNDKAKTLYQGLIKIESNAFGSNGYQKEDTLLLSQEAEADSIPNLEIDNNDVRCTHGAAIGQVDKNKLFYMQTRGISEEEGKRKIVEGFFEPMIQQIHISKIQQDIRQLIEAKMAR